MQPHHKLHARYVPNHSLVQASEKNVQTRFVAGAGAGATATLLTYPLDLLRARMVSLVATAQHGAVRCTRRRVYSVLVYHISCMSENVNVNPGEHALWGVGV